MDLVWFTSFLNKQLKAIHKESHYKWNHSKTVEYPYLTYNYESTPIDDIRDEFSVTINIFDYGISSKNILELENRLINGLNKNYQELDKAFVYIRTGRSLDIPTQNDSIQRRELQLIVKVDWKIKGDDI